MKRQVSDCSGGAKRFCHDAIVAHHKRALDDAERVVSEAKRRCTTAGSGLNCTQEPSAALTFMQGAQYGVYCLAQRIEEREKDLVEHIWIQLREHFASWSAEVLSHTGKGGFSPRYVH